MITHEQVKDLRPGDVVELFRNYWPDGSVVRGPLYSENGYLYVANVAIVDDSERMPLGASYFLTVVSRAPRLYVNHPRTEPVQGDVVRFEDTRCPENSYTNVYDNCGDRHHPWLALSGERWRHDQAMPRESLRHHYSLRLLVDGETGQVVP